jgi:hypothetical protein
MRFSIPALAGLSLLAGIAALALVPAGGRASGQSWSAATRLDTCAAATQPKVVFPFSSPNTRSGEGAIVWLGSSPSCTDRGSGARTFDIAALHSDDSPVAPRPLTTGAAAATNLAAPLYTAATTHGQIVAIAAAGDGAPMLGDGFARSGIAELQTLGGSDELVATMDGFIGDVDVATVVRAPSAPGYEIELRAQRHYSSAFGRALYLPVGSGTVTALAIGMDFRADRLVVWAQGGRIWAQYVTNGGRIKPRQLLGPSGYAPQISAVLSDDDHAFVLWTDEPPLGVVGPTSVYLAHSGFGPTFHRATVLAAFTQAPGVRLTPGAVAAERLSSEGVALLWPAMTGGNYVIDAAGATQTGVLAPSVLAQAGQDLRLGAVATGPQNEIVVLVEDAPRTTAGFDQSRQELLATRSNEVRDPGGLGFGPLTEIAPSASNSDPSVGVDPDTDSAVAAWQTTAFGVPAIDYAVGSGS